MFSHSTLMNFTCALSGIHGILSLIILGYVVSLIAQKNKINKQLFQIFLVVSIIVNMLIFTSTCACKTTSSVQNKDKHDTLMIIAMILAFVHIILSFLALVYLDKLNETMLSIFLAISVVVSFTILGLCVECKKLT